MKAIVDLVVLFCLGHSVVMLYIVVVKMTEWRGELEGI